MFALMIIICAPVDSVDDKSIVRNGKSSIKSFYKG